MISERPEFFTGTEMPTSGWWEALWPDPASVLSAVGLKPGLHVVDLCSGDGWFTLPIAKIANHVVAVDLDPALLEVAKNALAAEGLTNCNFVVGDAYEIAKLVPEPMNFIYMANAFHGVPDQPRLARAVYETLAPGGLFSVVNWHQRPREETIISGEPRGPRTELRLSPAQTVDAVTLSGLTLMDIVEIPPYHYGAVFKRPKS
ncbi:class I SAM-dependent methyltransferase [Phyllobacterium sp. LjRoot231]|uniref:class I SAM-dependent methyltransferase n=1 Tax=Phyllobacterium sp. LjRoot231 TaxID=3342289 RepID=UPI003ECF8786